MTTPDEPSTYRELVQKTPVPASPPPPDPENELDSLIAAMKGRRQRDADRGGTPKRDSIQALRELTINEFIPIFVELVEKYSKSGISMQMDASNFLQGGREIKFEFGIGECQAQLLGTVTTEAIAFHETRYSPNMQGELVSGPMLRLRNLTGQVFRNFVCERLVFLIRVAAKRR